MAVVVEVIPVAVGLEGLHNLEYTAPLSAVTVAVASSPMTDHIGHKTEHWLGVVSGKAHSRGDA